MRIYAQELIKILEALGFEVETKKNGVILAGGRKEMRLGKKIIFFEKEKIKIDAAKFGFSVKSKRWHLEFTPLW